MRIVQSDAAAARDGDERIGFGRLAVELHRLEMQPRQGADDFEMAELLGADVHQQVLARRIVAVQALDGILHRGGELAVGAAELFEQHVAECGVGLRRRGRCTSAS